MRKHSGKINKIIIHITASNDSATVEGIRKQHKSQGWSDVGYHVLIDRKGVIHKGRDEQYIGSHVYGYNDRSIGIAYIGRGSDTDSNGDYGKYMTVEQQRGLEKATADTIKKYNLTINDVCGHNDVTKLKACPCFKVRGNSGKKFRDNVQALLDEKKNNFHTVTSGETLSIISKQYYGNTKDFMKIFNANKDILSDPNKINVGQKLIIP